MTAHDAEYFREYRARKRAENPDPKQGRPPVGAEVWPEFILRDGAVLREMMRTPFCLWKPDWLDRT